MATNNSSATTGLIVFLVLTLIYFIVRYNIEMGQSDTIYTIIYYLGVVVSQYFINLTAITSRCGNTNYYLAFMVTIVPWVFIFGLLNIMLAQFPGWKAPFSNTFGYLIANAAGARDILIDYILKDDFVSRLTPGKKETDDPQQGGRRRKSQKGGGDTSKLAIEAVQHIYSDPSLLINEITPDTYEQFWDKMTPLFKDGADEHKADLYKMIELKELVSEGIWYLLTGSLITSVSGNYIMNGDCGTSADEMKKRHSDYEKQQKKKAERESTETKKIYEVTQ